MGRTSEFYPTPPGQKINNQEDAINQLREIRAKDGTESEKCMVYESEDRDEYIHIQVHEKHTDGCPGDPMTFPLIGIYRVRKSDAEVSHYDIMNNRYVVINE